MMLSLLHSRFQGVQPREQMLVLLLAGVIVAVSLWLVIWKPIEAAKENDAQAYQNAREELEWMQAHASQARAVSGNRTRSIPAGSSLLSLASETAKMKEITINHAEPEGDRAVRLQVEETSFKNVLLWLDVLQREYHITVKTIAISRLPKTPGDVSVTLTLTD